ncbi:MAG: hypothetical protein PHD83_04230 [Caldisericia bacterium]|nr:hypothetical protein [Caldisericia bacterium]
MRKKIIINLITLIFLLIPCRVYSSDESLPASLGSSMEDWKLQWTFPNTRDNIGLKDIYIKEDEKNVYFRFTSYHHWYWDYDKEFSFGVFVDVDCDINTGLKSDGCHPLGDDLLIGFHFKKNKVSSGFVGVYDANTTHFERQYDMKPEEYSHLTRSLTFSVSKEYFTEYVCFDYILMLLYKYSEEKSEADVYPECSKTLSYPNKVYPTH